MGICSRLEAVSDRTLTRLVRQALGDDTLTVSTWDCHSLGGGTVAAVCRLSGSARKKGADGEAPWSLVLKALHRWTRRDDPPSWQREMLLYRSGLFDSLPTGLAVPQCFRIDEADTDEFWLWLEDVGGTTGEAMTIEQHGSAARHLGRFQGPYLAGRSLPEHEWLSTESYLADAARYWGFGAVRSLTHPRHCPRKPGPVSREAADAVLRLGEDLLRS